LGSGPVQIAGPLTGRRGEVPANRAFWGPGFAQQGKEAQQFSRGRIHFTEE
jgi:hypothetical protein